MGFFFPGIEQSCSGLDLIIGKQLWHEKIKPELERGKQSQGVLCKPVQSRKRIQILFLPRFTILFDCLYMLFGPTIRFVPFLLRCFYSLHHLVHPDLETSLNPFVFGCRENVGKYKNGDFLGSEMKMLLKPLGFRLKRDWRPRKWGKMKTVLKPWNVWDSKGCFIYLFIYFYFFVWEGLDWIWVYCFWVKWASMGF